MTHDTLPNEKDKSFPLEERSDADQIVLECNLTEYRDQDASSVTTADTRLTMASRRCW
jgi:hypothetical protein